MPPLEVDSCLECVASEHFSKNWSGIEEETLTNSRFRGRYPDNLFKNAYIFREETETQDLKVYPKLTGTHSPTKCD